jgi:hypothetical protein
MGKSNWATFSTKRRMRQHGSEDAKEGASDGGTIKALFEQEGDRSARLRHYLETGPRGARDVETILDARMGDRLPSGQTRAERDAWLRGILDAW